MAWAARVAASWRPTTRPVLMAVPTPALAAVAGLAAGGLPAWVARVVLASLSLDILVLPQVLEVRFPRDPVRQLAIHYIALQLWARVRSH